MISARFAYLLLITSIFLSFSFPPPSFSKLSENEINDIISSLGVTDEDQKEQLRERYRRIYSEKDVEQLISQEREDKDIRKLAKTLGFDEVQKISVGATHPGYTIFLEVFDKPNWISENKYKQNVLYVAIKDILNSTLLLGGSNPIYRGNYYSNSDNIVANFICQIEHAETPLTIKTNEETGCDEIREIINLYEAGNFKISPDIKDQFISINWLEVSYVSKEASGFEIHTPDTPTSGKEFKIEKKGNNLFIKSISYIQS